MNHWTPYQSSERLPWDLRRVVHLHRRAGFAASWDQIQRDLKEGPQAAVARLLEGKSAVTGVPEEFESLAKVIGDAAVASNNPQRLKAWWLYRCLFSPHPLQERLTLMWHNHFATSNLKVDDLPSMKRQNETFRRLALAPCGELLAEMARDPALLVWLDAPSNRQGKPNENLARELMELFTLGIGHYTEQDIKEAARALTGRTVRQGEFREQEAAHDAGEKTILGKSGNFAGEDLVKLLLDQPATADRLAWRLTSELCGEGVVDMAARDELAQDLRRHNLDIRYGVETILASELFFSPANIGSRVSDPVSFLIGPLRALECWRDPPSTLVIAEWVARMGQDLFYPPNVGGWPGGRTWLGTRTVVARANCMAALAGGGLQGPPRRIDLERLVTSGADPHDEMESARFLSNLLFGEVHEETIQKVQPTDSQSRLAAVLLALLTSPQAHLH